MGTTLSAAQEAIVLHIRKLCLLPLDDLLNITQRFINAKASRSGVSRLLRREGMAKLSDLQPIDPSQDKPKKSFKHPQTNGMVERFNGRISEVVNQTRFASAAELESTLMNYQNTYNHHIPQRALNHLSPIEALQNWRDKSPELFVKRVYKRAELDN